MINIPLIPIASIFICFSLLSNAQIEKYTNANSNENIVFPENSGIIAVETEFFYKQTKTDVREWYRSSKYENPDAGRDEDTLHVYGASYNSYLVLPDKCVTYPLKTKT